MSIHPALSRGQESAWHRMAVTNPASVHQVYRTEQAGEILRRTRRIVDRVLPLEPSASAFFEPDQFMANSRHRSARKALSLAVQDRIRAKVEARDSVLSPFEVANRLSAGTAPNRRSWLGGLLP